MTTKTSNKPSAFMKRDDNGLGSVLSSYNKWNNFSSRTGIPNPKWRQQVRDGSNASTPFSGYHQGAEYIPQQATLQLWHPSSVAPGKKVITIITDNGSLGDVNSNLSYTNPSFTTANNQALTRLYKDIRNAQYHISGPQFLGELREAIHMLKHPAEGLVKYAQRYLDALDSRLKARRSGRTYKGGIKPTRLNKALADTWLEYSFGWSPFLGDIKTAAETLARWQTDIRRESASGFGQNSNVFYTWQPWGSASTSAGIYYQRSDMYWDDTIVKYRAGINAKTAADFGSARRLADLSGFQMQNFIPTAWELLPWSFFVDYFSNVGNVIEAGCTDLASVTRVTKSTVGTTYWKNQYRVDAQKNSQIYDPRNFLGVTGGIGNWYSFNRQVTRTIGPPDYPSLEFKLPGEPGQLANIAALFGSGRRMQPYRD